MSSPYSFFNDEAFWSRSVAKKFDAVKLAHQERPYFTAQDRIMSAGSCFAANIIPHITEAGFNYIYTERRSSLFRVPAENLSYDKFSASYGNIYTTRQLNQLIQQCMGTWFPTEDVWEKNGQFIDPYRPGLRYSARSREEFYLLKRRHLERVKEAFSKATVFVFTLGLTEAWVSNTDGAVFPACPGTVAGDFDKDRHSFKNFSVSEIVADMSEFIKTVRALNPELRIILTVSPVPLVATASGNHVLSATTYSKSALRVAVQDIIQSHDNVTYFPAYEIITGPQAPYSAFEPDRRNVSQEAITVVMDALLKNCENIGAEALHSEHESDTSETSRLQQLTRSIMEYECEEAMLDKH